jgi:hypothetical protein
MISIIDPGSSHSSSARDRKRNGSKKQSDPTFGCEERMEPPSSAGVISNSPGWKWIRESRNPRFHSSVVTPLRLKPMTGKGAE